jgi:spermidine synthase
MKIVNDDARRVLGALPSSTKFDAIFGDAFDDYEVPYHLTTRQFDELVAGHLRPRGLYLMNVIDGVDNDFLRSELRTLREVFPYVTAAPVAATWPPGSLRATFVILASKTPPARRLGEVVPVSLIDRFVAHGHSVVLTDDHAPVDQLLAPVFGQYLRKGH